MNRIALTAVAIVLGTQAFGQEEDSIDMADVPAPAMDAAMGVLADYGMEGAEFESVAIDDDEGTETYEFATTMDNGMAFEVDVLADGTVEEIETEIEMADVPEAVMTTLGAELPDWTPDFIERSERGDLIVYEFEGMLDGNEVDVEINEDGTGYVNNDDMAG